MNRNKEKLLNNLSPSIISVRYMLRSNINPNQPLNPAYLKSKSLSTTKIGIIFGEKNDSMENDYGFKRIRKGDNQMKYRLPLTS